jgi:hypothetical protein
MSEVEIVHVPAAGRFGYKWRWRSEDRSRISERSFDLYFECVADAQAHGFDVKRPPPPATPFTRTIE